jgi:hypothetical protein
VRLARDIAADVDAFAVALDRVVGFTVALDRVVGFTVVLDRVVGFTVVLERVVAFAVSRCGLVSLTGCPHRVAAADIPVPHAVVAVVFGERRDRVQCTAAVLDDVAVADPLLRLAKRGLALRAASGAEGRGRVRCARPPPSTRPR